MPFKYIYIITVAALSSFTVSHAAFSTDFATQAEFNDNFDGKSAGIGDLNWESGDGGRLRVTNSKQPTVLFDSSVTNAIGAQAGTNGTGVDNVYVNFTATMDVRIVNVNNSAGLMLKAEDAGSNAGYTFLLDGGGASGALRGRLFDSNSDFQGSGVGTFLNSIDFGGTFNGSNYYRIEATVTDNGSNVDFAFDIFDLGTTRSGTASQIGSTWNISDTTSAKTGAYGVGMRLSGQGGTDMLVTSFAVVPEPGTLALFGLAGLAALAFARRRS